MSFITHALAFTAGAVFGVAAVAVVIAGGSRYDD